MEVQGSTEDNQKHILPLELRNVKVKVKLR